VVFSQTHTGIKRELKRLLAWCELNGMSINAAKCGLMIVPGVGGYTKPAHKLLTYDVDDVSYTIPYVEKYKYLGLTICRSLSVTTMAEERVQATAKAVAALQPFFLKRSSTVSLKRAVLSMVVGTSLLYGCEVWGHSATARKTVVVAYNNAIRAAFRLPVNMPVHLLGYVLGLARLEVRIAQLTFNAFYRWSQGRFLISDLSFYDIENTVRGKTQMRSMFSYLQRLRQRSESAPPMASVILRYSCAVQKEMLASYAHSRMLGAFSLAPPTLVAYVSRQFPAGFLSVREWLMVLIGYWHGASALVKFKQLDDTWADKCPCCEEMVPETLPHYLFECSKFSEFRTRFLSGARAPLYTECSSRCDLSHHGEHAPGWDCKRALQLGGSPLSNDRWFVPNSQNHMVSKISRRIYGPIARRLLCLLKFVHEAGVVRRPIIERLRTEHAQRARAASAPADEADSDTEAVFEDVDELPDAGSESDEVDEDPANAESDADDDDEWKVFFVSV
jgi:hypothetical protein